MRAAAVAVLLALVGASGCKRRAEPAPAPVVDAAAAPRPRPAMVAHLTLKALGMT